ncbi:MAG: HAD hydrolase family protein [Verrucomicrobia bacterium]|nr:HAD hydrolase family protein [Verrucomicrobiota bacterium]
MKTPLPFQLLSTDFDGTFYAEFENPPVPHALAALLARLQARGVHWVINTGRDLSGLLEAMARARLTIQPQFVVVVEREIYRHDGARYVSVEPWNEDCRRAQAELFARVRPDVPELMAWVNARFTATLYEDAYSPFCLIAGNNDDADEIMAHLEAYCRRVPDLTLVRNDVYARFSHAAYNKGTALSEIARQLGVPSEQVLAAGDHYNDLPMLANRRARWLLAPANAVPLVQETVRQQLGYVSPWPCGEGLLDGLQSVLKHTGRRATAD